MRLHYESSQADFWYDDNRNTASFMSFYTKTEDRGKGYGTKILRMVRKFAERRGCPVYLRAAPFSFDEHPPLSLGKTMAFYENRGFVPAGPIQGGTCPMVLIPKKRS